jgi:hypothetical protein
MKIRMRDNKLPSTKVSTPHTGLFLIRIKSGQVSGRRHSLTGSSLARPRPRGSEAEVGAPPAAGMD